MTVFPSGSSALVVDDEAPISEMICEALSAEGVYCRSASNGIEALARLAEEHADIVITDVRMPGMNGLELLEQVRSHYPDIFVVLLTGTADVPTVIRALRSGACDFLTKPFSISDLCERVQLAAKNRSERLLEVEEHRENESLVSGLKERCRELHEGVLQSLRTVLDLAHPDTSAHSERVAIRAASMAKEMGSADEDIGAIYLAGLLHDLGKVTLDREIVTKPGRLDSSEMSHMQLHPDRSARIVSTVPLPQVTLDAIRHHHERFDGTGYPDSLRGENIPFSARILAVCDSFDAMVSERTYSPALSVEEGIRRLREGAGSQFDPGVVDVFCSSGLATEMLNGNSADKVTR